MVPLTELRLSKSVEDGSNSNVLQALLYTLTPAAHT